MADLTAVKDLGNLYGIPEYIWRSIMEMESGGNPNAHALTDREDSRGLFQINIQANPKYKNLDLYNPKVNAEVAFKDFILPSWNLVKGTGMPAGEQAAYVWRYGIRPKWTEEKAESIMFKASAIASGIEGQTPDPDANNTDAGSGGEGVLDIGGKIKNIADTFTNKTLPSIGFIVAGIICGVLAITFLFGSEEQ